MKRERRYVVLKLTDLQKYLTVDQRNDLARLEEIVSCGREADGRAPLTGVYVEADWPEHEPVWKMIERRVSDEAYCTDGHDWDVDTESCKKCGADAWTT